MLRECHFFQTKPTTQLLSVAEFIGFGVAPELKLELQCIADDEQACIISNPSRGSLGGFVTLSRFDVSDRLCASECLRSARTFIISDCHDDPCFTT
jgi:hypothetical protein